MVVLAHRYSFSASCNLLLRLASFTHHSAATGWLCVGRGAVTFVCVVEPTSGQIGGSRTAKAIGQGLRLVTSAVRNPGTHLTELGGRFSRFNAAGYDEYM